MKSMYGKIVIIVVLLVAIVGVVQLKQRQGATAPPQAMVTQDAQPSSPSQPVTAVSPKTTSAIPTKETPATAPKSVTPSGAAHTPSTGKTPAATTPVKRAAALPRLLELGSDSCRPCQMMQPVLAALRADYAGKLHVDFIDVWKDESAGKRYDVQAIPTQIFFDAKGKEVFRHVGFYPKDEILTKFKELGISF